MSFLQNNLNYLTAGFGPIVKEMLKKRKKVQKKSLQVAEGIFLLDEVQPIG